MGIEKAEIKIGVAQELGRQYAAMAKGLTDELNRLEGEKRAYKKAVQSLDSIFQRVDDDLDAGNYEGVSDPVEVAKLLKKTLVQAVGCLDSLKDQNMAAKLQAAGRLEGILKSSELVERLAKTEQGKIESAAEALEIGTDPVEAGSVVAEASGAIPGGEGFFSKSKPRPPGVRPGSSIAAQRKAEEAAQNPGRTARKASQRAAKASEPATTGSSVTLGDMIPQSGVKARASSPQALKSGGTKKTAKKTAKKIAKKTAKKIAKKTAKKIAKK
jgi:hypothetical protein